MEILNSDDLYFYSNSPDYSNKNTKTPGLSIENNIIFSDFYLEVQYFIYLDENYFYISDDIRLLRKISQTNLCINGIIQLAIFKANVYPFSIYEKIIPIPCASSLKVEKSNIILKKYDFISKFDDKEKSFFKIHSILYKYMEKAGKNPYIMYSGGIDSSICFNYINNPKTIVGSSIFTNEQLEDVENGIKRFPFYKKNYEYQKSSNFIETIINYKFFSPFIDLGVYDDLIHVKKSYEMKATSLINGLGPDELMGVAYCRDIGKLQDFDYFINKYSMLKPKLLYNLFEKERVKFVFEETMKNYTFDDIKDIIHFTIDYHQIPLQHGLTRSNGKYFPTVKRIFPFSNKEFHNVILNLPDNLIYNNGIEKYFLRLYAKKILPKNYWTKKKKPFDADYYKIIKDNREDIDAFLNTKMKEISQFKQTNNDISGIEPMDRLNLFMYINCLKDFK
ncbi:MAG: asparagine synthase-related protein [Candidatus Muirbacterium halophilum]|nr:asparagine synthase-related protein [Candidatus Muirbacterium halophilum]MCK9477409.1 asparagine synthase-related protein [Candidatus Muirbacterium halophilum]